MFRKKILIYFRPLSFIRRQSETGRNNVNKLIFYIGPRIVYLYHHFIIVFSTRLKNSMIVESYVYKPTEITEMKSTIFTQLNSSAHTNMSTRDEACLLTSLSV